MGRPTELTHPKINKIAKLTKLQLTQKEISDLIGVTPRTFRNWIKKGKETQEGLEWKLVCAVRKAEVEAEKDYAQVVENAALIGGEVVTTVEMEQPDGSFLTKRTIKREPPNAGLAFNWLKHRRPEKYAEQHKHQVDWKDHLKSQGHDPEVLKALAKAYLEKRESAEETEETDTEPDNSA